MNASSVASATGKGAATGAAFGPWGAVIGGGVGLLSSLFDKQKAAPTTPFTPSTFTPTDLGAAQQKSITNNAAALPGVNSLLGASNTFQQGQANSLMEQAIPGWSKLQSQLTNLTTQTATNPYQLPPDVTQNLSRIAAERGISAGTRGQFNDFSLLRDLGVNSLQYGQSRIQQAQGLAQTLVGLSPRVNPMSPLSFLIGPQQEAQIMQQNNSGAQATQQYNEAGARGVNQSGANAATAAQNFNTNNTWQSILQGIFAGGVLGAPAKSG